MNLGLRAAQYLRMSTEHQRYSLASQAATLATYAAVRDIEIVATYADHGKSGLSIRSRDGLQRLLADVLSGTAAFSQILVYDVSRWGRFQNPDEAAHYEFICLSAGFQVHYCAEPFPNDGAMVSTVLKHLKRVMAAEYSRELSAKVRAAQIMQARLGYVQGGVPPFGLRRLLISADGSPRCILGPGERKGLATDRVVWTLGPDEEVKLVHRIYDLYTRRGVSIYKIAYLLRTEGVEHGAGGKWTPFKVRKILSSAIYVGDYVYARHTKPLGGPAQPIPKAQWVSSQMLAPIIPKRQWMAAQRRLESNGRRCSYGEEELLMNLREILKEHGSISARHITSSPHAASVTTYVARFGGLLAAYAKVDYRPSRRTTFGRGRHRDTDEEMLEHLRNLHREHGYVSATLIAADRTGPCPASYFIRFGGLLNAYKHAGLPCRRGALQRATALRRFGLSEGSHDAGRPVHVADIRELMGQGLNRRQAAERLGISKTSADRLLLGQTRFAVPRGPQPSQGGPAVGDD